MLRKLTHWALTSNDDDDETHRKVMVDAERNGAFILCDVELLLNQYDKNKSFCVIYDLRCVLVFSHRLT